eukprot:CAMPEP_0201564050 /NCGR_PEP_ID=MMETSP0190_2-20130828/1866_1 /ASSEMBLY_ACC=CAM_ASM_000263 /TAXON_ID=37353 /ORGANISM="Rosalina sp." /LENGTH=337 /DNA_ID=CAMNT_0047979667 /DNA_START=145 /DNA_END=1159 /DNA_ORIENTATION=+
MSDQQTTQSKYRKKKKDEQQPSIDPNEVRIKGNQGHVKRYVDYACSLLEGKRIPGRDNRRRQREQEEAEAAADDATKTEEKKDGDEDAEEEKPEEPQKFDTIVLKATGRAINKAVTTAEVVKRRISALHQVTSLETLEITDVWEPTEQGLKEVETKRRVASITITLSRDKTAISEDAPGYQQPITSDVISPFNSDNNEDKVVIEDEVVIEEVVDITDVVVIIIITEEVVEDMVVDIIEEEVEDMVVVDIKDVVVIIEEVVVDIEIIEIIDHQEVEEDHTDIHQEVEVDMVEEEEEEEEDMVVVDMEVDMVEEEDIKSISRYDIASHHQFPYKIPIKF